MARYIDCVLVYYTGFAHFLGIGLLDYSEGVAGVDMKIPLIAKGYT